MARSRREELSVRRIRSLLTVAEHRSFTEAAQVLGLTQPAVSQHIRQLEDQLRISLLVRDKEGLRLSPGCAALMPAFRRFITSNGAILDHLASLGQGTEQILRIASPSSYASLFIGPAYQGLRDQFPSHILDISEIDDEESFQLVRDGDMDFAITSVFVPSPGLHFEALHQDTACLVMSERNALAKETKIDDEAILSQPLIRFPSGTTSHHWLSTIAERAGTEPNSIAEVRQLLTGFQLIRQDLGVAVVPEGAAKTCALPGLVSVSLNDPTLVRTLGIVTNATHHPTDFERALVDQLRSQVIVSNG